jgi:hypothetical protein
MLAQIVLRIVPLIGCTFLANMGALVSDVTRAVTVYNTAAVRAALTSQLNSPAQNPLRHNLSFSVRVLRRRP